MTIESTKQIDKLVEEAFAAGFDTELDAVKPLLERIMYKAIHHAYFRGVEAGRRELVETRSVLAAVQPAPCACGCDCLPCQSCDHK